MRFFSSPRDRPQEFLCAMCTDAQVSRAPQGHFVTSFGRAGMRTTPGMEEVERSRMLEPKSDPSCRCVEHSFPQINFFTLLQKTAGACLDEALKAGLGLIPTGRHVIHHGLHMKGLEEGLDANYFLAVIE